MMPGGEREAYARIEPMVTKMAAQVDGTPCCTFIGPGGAGHYVKMVHNGIEYADMQLITEAYDLHQDGLRPGRPRHRRHLRAVEDGRARFLPDRDHRGGAAQDAMPQPAPRWSTVIVDEAEQKGTGRWTAANALELGVPLDRHHGSRLRPRSVSSQRKLRIEAEKLLPSPPGRPAANRRPGRHRRHPRRAATPRKIVAYAQGFEQMTAASKEYGWDLKLGEVATIWRGGCIIRARFLDRIREAYGSRGRHSRT